MSTGSVVSTRCSGPGRSSGRGWDSATRHAVAIPAQDPGPLQADDEEPTYPDLESPDLSETERQLLELAGQVTGRGK